MVDLRRNGVHLPVSALLLALVLSRMATPSHDIGVPNAGAALAMPVVTIGSGCASLGESGTYYRLTADIDCASKPTVEFDLGVSNSVLDCGGHHIFSSWGGPFYSAAVYLPRGNHNDTIENCIVEVLGNSARTSNGVLLNSSAYCTLQNNTFVGFYWSGIYAASSTGVRLLGNLVTNITSSGMFLTNSTLLQVARNTVKYDNIGIEAESVTRSLFVGNLGEHNKFASIYLGMGSSYNNVTSNVAMFDTDDGIVLSGQPAYPDEFNRIFNNTLQANYDSGIELSYSRNNTIVSNRILGNSPLGIFLNYANNQSTLTYNLFEKNTVLSSYYPIGFVLSGSTEHPNFYVNNVIGNMSITSPESVAIEMGISTWVTVNGEPFNILLTGVGTVSGIPSANLTIDGHRFVVTAQKEVIYHSLKVAAIEIDTSALGAIHLKGVMLLLSPTNNTTSTSTTTSSSTSTSTKSTSTSFTYFTATKTWPSTTTSAMTITSQTSFSRTSTMSTMLVTNGNGGESNQGVAILESAVVGAVALLAGSVVLTAIRKRRWT